MSAVRPTCPAGRGRDTIDPCTAAVHFSMGTGSRCSSLLADRHCHVDAPGRARGVSSFPGSGRTPEKEAPMTTMTETETTDTDAVPLLRRQIDSLDEAIARLV